MKIIYLNTWAGKQKSEISDFFKMHVNDTDIFCLQEAYDDFRSSISEFLEDFQEFYFYQYGHEHENGIEDYAQVTYVRKSIPVLTNTIIVDELKPGGLGLALEVEYNGMVLNILNCHGISRPKDKLDSPERLKQSQLIVSYYEKKKGPKILGGDFNFLPQTESYNMFLQSGEYKELVQEYNIPTTRSRHFFENRPQKHLFSDYVFVTNDVHVSSFEVPNIEVSDHLPLILNIQ